MREVDVERGMTVRLYDRDDWYWPGKVLDGDVDGRGSIDVDYGDWIQRYPRGAIRLFWSAEGFYEEYLAPTHEGVRMQDFEDPDFITPDEPVWTDSVRSVPGRTRRPRPAFA